MAHNDENINGKYCKICKNRVAMVEALFNTTYVCEQCMVNLATTLKNYEVVKTEGMNDDGKKQGSKKMQANKLQ